MAFLRLEKVKWSHFFAKKAFQIQIVSEKAKNRTKNKQKTTKKRCFYRHFCLHSANGGHHLRNSANVAAPFAEFCKWCAPFPEMVRTVCGMKAKFGQGG